jgi:DNA ligase-associated metallophosphoesterase
MTDGTVALEVQGETLRLHPDRAVIWPRLRTVIVADTHFGKTGHFGRHGIAVPAGTDDVDRERLNRLMVTTESRRLVILGDFLHAPLAPSSPDALDLEYWARSLEPATIHVVAGNHDAGARQRWCDRLQWCEHELLDPPFRFIHNVEHVGSNAGSLFALSGHVHPVVRLRNLPKHGPRIPVFWQRATGLVLPSFGLFTGGFAVAPRGGERIFAVGPVGVVPFAEREN